MPISKAVATAEQISKGNFKDRIVENYNTKEITRLTETINNLADTLDRQQEIRKHMAADVAHELRTPLATLQSHMEAMIDGIWKPEHERLESCHEEILRISRLVGDMEKLARVENKNIVLDKSEFDLAEAAKHIINNFQPDFMNKGVGLEFTGDSLLINGDRDKISQILINLISNALKYTDMGGAVRVAIECTPASALIKVSDTGSGISAEDIPFIFERFYRADKSRNRLTGGSGIGLAIARAIVELHKGSISVTSEIGRGSEFIVTLPRS